MRVSYLGVAYIRMAAQAIGTLMMLTALAWVTSDAHGQSIGRGQMLYAQLGCNTSNCHGVNPGANLNQLLNGAGSPAAIEYVVSIRTEMQHLRAAFDVDESVAIDLAAWLATITPDPPPPPPLPVATVVEYHHSGFGHYFTTSIAAEIAALDSGQVAGWVRTGRSFTAYASGDETVVPVCRFFTVAFAPKSSHFYTPVASECEGLRAPGGVWQFEGEAFWVRSADASGACPTGTSAVYRLYNNGQSGAPNHRYTTDPAVRTEMLGKGWLAEGHGPLGVIFCALQ